MAESLSLNFRVFTVKLVGVLKLRNLAHQSWVQFNSPFVLSEFIFSHHFMSLIRHRKYTLQNNFK